MPIYTNRARGWAYKDRYVGRKEEGERGIQTDPHPHGTKDIKHG